MNLYIGIINNYLSPTTVTAAHGDNINSIPYVGYTIYGDDIRTNDGLIYMEHT